MKFKHIKMTCPKCHTTFHQKVYGMDVNEGRAMVKCQKCANVVVVEVVIADDDDVEDAYYIGRRRVG